MKKHLHLWLDWKQLRCSYLSPAIENLKCTKWMSSHHFIGNLEEEFYIEQPEGFQLTNKGDYACKLNKTLYGL